MKKFIKIITSLFIVITSCLYILDQNGYLNNTAFALSNKDEETLKTSKINNGNLKIYFLDQTTPNMIQRISVIFERNPLISKDI